MRKIQFDISCLALYLAFIVGASSAQAPPTPDQVLAGKGIGSSQRELMQALQSRDVYVRSMAAAVLATRGDKAALPAINRELDQATDDIERLNLATALHVLADPRGLSEMELLCKDVSVSNQERLLAADRLQSYGNDTCFLQVAAMLSTDKDPVLRTLLFQHLLKSKETLDPSSGLYSAVTHQMEVSLQSDSSYDREQAANCIVKYHMTDTLPWLSDAQNKETDPRAKAALEHAQTVLTQKP